MKPTNLKSTLSAEAFRVTQQKGTERPFTGEWLAEWREGTYHCVCCDATLFDSTTKFESGCGWPSFHSHVAENVDFRPDNSLGMRRVEIVCAKCEAHLGHVFEDGPAPTGQRYCVNSVSLTFNKKNS